ncbi:MAG: hypothetical protein DRQ59_06690 [Gammaproteobacteria bacterium]|nr:MAG: hypothetical protein DRQ59_06690 [Gammaproteobacteria bacterium]
MQSLCKFFYYGLGITAVFIAGTIQASGSALQHRVEDLAYGQALFHYFQQNELPAITQLLVAKQGSRTQTQIEESELLLADLYYSYGLYRESGMLFSRLQEEDTSAGIKNRVWFNLARLNYDQGQYDTARELLAKIDDVLPVQIESERQYLLTNLYLGNMQYQQAVDASRGITAGSVWRAYADYNLGVSMVENNQFDQGKELLDSLGRMPTDSIEMTALRDQANLALGFSLLRRSKPEAALANFSRIRLQGPLSHKALLGAGWAWSRLDNFDRALVPWLELTRQNSIDIATQEALLAIPTTLEQDRQSQLAVKYFELAADQFDLQLVVLDEVVTSIRQGEVIAALQQNRLVNSPGRFDQAPPPSVAAPYLYILMASEAFEQEVRRYQELLDIRIMLAHWDGNLPTLDLMLIERRKNFEQKLPLLEQSNDLPTLTNLQRSRENYASKLNDIETRQDYLSLASVDEKQQLQRLDRIALGLNKLRDRKNTDSEADMHRLLSGLLDWQISTDYAPRLWQARKQLHALDRAMLESEQRAQSLAQLTDLSRARFAEFEHRIDGQDARIKNLYERVGRLINRQESRINRLAISAIQQQQQRIIQLRLNARYSVARLYDSLVSE